MDNRDGWSDRESGKSVQSVWLNDDDDDDEDYDDNIHIMGHEVDRVAWSSKRSVKDKNPSTILTVDLFVVVKAYVDR